MRSAADGTTRGGDAAPQRVPVMLARETVTDLTMEVSMTATEAARADWCVGATTASSSAPTSTPRTTAVNTRTAVEAGASGESSVPAARAVVWVGGPGTGTARVPAVLTPLSLSRGSVTLNLACNYLQLAALSSSKYKTILFLHFICLGAG